jgi:hypothetical protein
MNQPPRIQIDSVARHDLSETFADSFTNVSFDGQSWRIEFCATRVDPPTSPRPTALHAKRVPVCRLALTPQLGFELAAKLSSLLAEMEKQGAIKRVMGAPMPPTSGKPN